MNIKLLIKSTLLSICSMGFASNLTYVLGVGDGSICKPIIDINFAFFMLFLCGLGVYAGIVNIAENKNEKKEDEANQISTKN